MKLSLTNDEAHSLHVVLGEALSFFKKRKGHQKEHKKEKCMQCTDYARLRLKFVKLCDCSDELDLSLKDKLGNENYAQLKKVIKGHNKLVRAISKLERPIK